MTWKILSCEVNTAQKMKFSIKDFFSKCDQIRSLMQIWSHLLKKSLMGNFIFFSDPTLFLWQKTISPFLWLFKYLSPYKFDRSLNYTLHNFCQEKELKKEV